MKKLRASFSQFAFSWLGLGSVYAASGARCPCCGGSACPVGFGAAGIVGLMGAIVLRKLRRPPAKLHSDDHEQ